MHLIAHATIRPVPFLSYHSKLRVFVTCIPSQTHTGAYEDKAECNEVQQQLLFTISGS